MRGAGIEATWISACVLLLYYRGQFYVFPEGIHRTALGSTNPIYTLDSHGTTIICTSNKPYDNFLLF